MSSSEVITEAAKRLEGPHQERILLWKTSLSTASSDSGFLDRNAQALVGLLLRTLPVYHDREAQRAVNHAVKIAVENETFLKALAGGLVKAAGGACTPQDAFTLLEWSSLLLPKLDVEGAKKAVDKIVEVQGALLQQCMDLPDHRWHTTCKALKRCVQHQPQLIPVYLEMTKSLGHPALVRWLMELMGSLEEPQREAIKQCCLSLFCERVIASKEKPSRTELVGYEKLMEVLSSKDLQEVVLPALTRSLKRTPESAMTVVVALGRHLQADLSQVGEELIATLVQQLRLKDSLRPLGLEALQAVARHVGDPDVVGKTAKSAMSILNGSSEGRIKNAPERTTLVSVIQGLSLSPGKGQAVSLMASEVVEGICKYYKEEVSEEVRLALLQCLAQWLPRCQQLPLSATQQLVSGLMEVKEAVRRAHLKAMASAVQAGVDCKGKECQPLLAPLVKILNEALAKPLLRSDGLLALLVLATLAAEDTTADAFVQKEKVWAQAVHPGSALLAPTTIAKLPPQECRALAELCLVLLTQHPHRLEKVPGAADHLCQVLTLLLMHYSKDVRKVARSCTLRCVTREPQWLRSLAAALRFWMNEGPPKALVQDGSAEESSTSPHGLSMRYSLAVESLLPASLPSSDLLTAVDLGQLLLAAHHPSITDPMLAHAVDPGKETTRVWQRLCDRNKYVEKQLMKDAAGLAEVLVGPCGLQSSTAGDRTAAVRAIGGALSIMPASLFPHVLEPVSHLLSREDHDLITDQDVEVFHTPEGILSTERQPEGVYVPEVVESKNKRKPRGRMRMDRSAFGGEEESSDEEPAAAPPPASRAPAPSMRANGVGGPAGRTGARGAGARGPAGGRGGSGPGGGKKDASAREQEFRMKRLAEEAEVRSRVMAIKERLELGLAVIGAMACCNRDFMALQLQEVAPLVMPLLTSGVVGEAAFHTADQSARCLPGLLGQRHLDVAASLRLVSQMFDPQAGKSIDLPNKQQVRDVIGALTQVTASKVSIPSAVYWFIFPVLQAVLSLPQHSPLHEPALAVVGLHVAPGEDIPREQTLTLLYHLLGVVPAFRDRVQPLLCELCRGVTDELPAALAGLLAPLPAVRYAALIALGHVPCIAEGVGPDEDEFVEVIYIACHDVSTDNQKVATELWEQAGCQLEPPHVEALVPWCTSEHADVRSAASAALAEGLLDHPDCVEEVLQSLTRTYNPSGPVCSRMGMGLALKHIAPSLAGPSMTLALDFLITEGLADPDEEVRGLMVGAGMALVDCHGAATCSKLLPQFEAHLQRVKGAPSREEARQDLVREGVVVLLGTLARHLHQEDPKRRTIVSTLISVLGTPSEPVQRAVGDCLPPLISPLAVDRQYVEDLLSQLMKQLTKGPSFGDRRGAAFGLAGVVKGLGITALKNFQVLDQLKVAIEDKAKWETREGALLGFECLCMTLGRLFEPYVIHLLPLLLGAFSDVTVQVREASEEVARAIMRNLTAPGVKLVLPALLKGLEDKQWRTKQGSIQLLGAMAYCAPKQLGTCLPLIVPRLSEVLSDPHPKVQAAAEQSLREVGSVIRNEEVKELVPHLLGAINHPEKNTTSCLNTLLETVFVHTVDAASLALIVPVLHRALRDRSGDNKKKAGRIVGNMCSLINDPKDMVPYVPVLLPELQKALVDPLPEVRATAARALGSLLKGMGIDTFPDLLPWLMNMLRSEGSAVERSGAAQGLAEVLAVLGANQLEVVMPQLLSGCRDRNVYVREGHITLFQYLPLTMEDKFQKYLSTVLPAILDGLSDEAEGVRDAALSAGRTLVDLYAQTALKLILPAVEEGVFHENWRIRQSSVELMGELLFKVAGTSGKIQTAGGSDDEGVAIEYYGQAILHALGLQRRNEVLARLYIVRSDVQYPVRSAALHVWKTVVVNTPRTLAEILPAVMDMLIASLAHEAEDRRTMAARCLGELVRKMGDRVLSKIIPILKEDFDSPLTSTRQGVCFGLKEVLESMSRTQLMEHIGEVLPAVQTALCDEDADVREAAGAAFSILFKGGAGSVVDSVVPSLLVGLEADVHYSQSLQGLQVLLGVRPQLMNSVIPKLLRQPVQLNNIKALGAMAQVIGPHLGHHLSFVLSTCLLLSSRHQEEGESAKPLHLTGTEAAVKVALSLPEEMVDSLISEIMKALEDPSRRLGAVHLIAVYCRSTRMDLEDHVPELMTALIVLLAEDDPMVVRTSWEALAAVCGTIAKEDQASHVRTLQEAVATAREKERRKRRGGQLLVAGFCLPKALAPILPIYLQGVLQGSSMEVREMAAEGLGELVDVTSEEGLRPFTVQITGPLIRIIGDRFPSQVKAAILTTLGLLIRKAGPGLKPFVPQLQTTFLKCLNDQAANVRNRAAQNLGDLTQMSVRVDQLVGDLANNARTAEALVAEAYLGALRGALLVSGDRISAPAMSKVGEVLLAIFKSPGDEESFLIALASCLGAYCKSCTLEDCRALLQAGPLSTYAPSNWTDRYAHALLVASVARYAAPRLEGLGLIKPVGEVVLKYAKDDKVQIRIAAVRAIGRLALQYPQTTPGLNHVLSSLLGPDQSSETQRQALLTVQQVTAKDSNLLEPHLGNVLPNICSILQRDPSSLLKSAAEQTLRRLLRLEDGLEFAQRQAQALGGSYKTQLSEAFLRRLQKQGEEELEAEDF